MFLRLVSAVEHAHTMGITHADLKPSQVLFAQDGSVRVSVGRKLSRFLCLMD